MMDGVVCFFEEWRLMQKPLKIRVLGESIHRLKSVRVTTHHTPQVSHKKLRNSLTF